MKIQILEVAHHRNGVSGEPFYAVRFYPYRKPKERFLGIVFAGAGQCAVIRSDLLETAGVEFGVNSWRGDDYEPALRAAVASFEIQRGIEEAAASWPFGAATPLASPVRRYTHKAPNPQQLPKRDDDMADKPFSDYVRPCVR